jgi:hypothetical protein
MRLDPLARSPEKRLTVFCGRMMDFDSELENNEEEAQRSVLSGVATVVLK